MLPFDTLVLNKYRILRSPNRRDGLLGKGTFGNVYLAHEELADRDVAIKELGLDAGDLESQQEEALRRFLTEGRLGLRIRHPNILEVYAIEPYEDGYLLVMELAESGDLKGLMGKGRPELRRAIEISEGIGLGLQAAHERGIVHRDLKPGNVFMMQDGTPKVADFGVAHIPQAIGGYLTMTRTGFQPGTVIYMSPEQAYGRRIDHRSDLYSLAVMLFELLTGSFYVDMQKCRELAQSQSTTTPALEELKFFQAFMDLAFTDSVPRPSERNPAVPPWLDAVVMRGLERDPEDRWQSGREFAAALRAGPTPADATVVARPFFPDETLVEPLTPASLGHRRPSAPPPTGTPVDAPTSRYTGPMPAAPADTMVASSASADTIVSPAAEAMYIKPPPTGSRLAGPSPSAAPPDPDATYIVPARSYEAAARAVPTDRPATGNGVAPAANDQPTVVVPSLRDGTAASPAARRAPLDEINTPRQAWQPAGGAADAGAAWPATPAPVSVATPAPARRGRPLWLLIGAPIAALAVVGGVAAFALKGGSTPKPTPTPVIASTRVPATAVSNSGTVVPAATGIATSSPSATPPPSATPVPSAHDVSNEVLLAAHPGATMIDREEIAGVNGDPGSVALLSQIVGKSGDCPQKFFDFFHPDASGKWVSAWDGSKLPSAAQPLLGNVSRTDAGCLPDAKEQVGPLQSGGQPAAAVHAVNADGQRVVMLQWDASKSQVVTLYDQPFTVPGTQIGFPDNGQPVGIDVSENAYPPPSSGLNPSYDKPIGRFAEDIAFQGNSFVADGQQLTLNCSSGTLQTKSATALLFSCPDGSPGGQGAVAITADTAFADGISFDDLQQGDDVTVTLADGASQPTDPLNALPPAAKVQSQQATNRKRATPTPTQAPVTPPRSTGTGSTTQPVQPRPTGGGSTTQPPVSQPPVSQPPVSQPPVSQPPVATQPPASTGGGGAGLGGGTSGGGGGAGLGGGGGNPQPQPTSTGGGAGLGH